LLQKISQLEQQKSEESGKISLKVSEVKQEYKQKEEDFISKVNPIFTQISNK